MATERNHPTAASNTMDKIIVVAGANGGLGSQITHNLLLHGAAVRALVRRDTDEAVLTRLKQWGAVVTQVDYESVRMLTQACSGGSCVVSALSGVRHVIVDAQTNLLYAAVDAGVPRFIPSDYCIDYTKLAAGNNRNLDLRREFSARADAVPIATTSILNGMFMDLLKGQAPVILPGIRRILYWGRADQPMDFTMRSDTAAFTAAAALDDTTPRYLRIAGEVATIRDLKHAATEATGHRFHLLRAGSLSGLERMIHITRTLAPGKRKAFPAWQGMQYLHDMLSGETKLESLDNDRYAGIPWTSVRQLLAGKVPLEKD